MALDVNGTAILQAIAKAPEAFAMSEAQLSVLAMSTLLQRFKDKSLGIKHVRTMRDAIGPEDFALALDHLPARDLSALVKRLDPKHPDIRSGDEQWQRNQVSNLAAAKIEPVTAPSRATRAPTPKNRSRTPKTGDIMASEALAPKAPAKKASPKKKAVS